MVRETLIMPPKWLRLYLASRLGPEDRLHSASSPLLQRKDSKGSKNYMGKGVTASAAAPPPSTTGKGDGLQKEGRGVEINL